MPTRILWRARSPYSRQRRVARRKENARYPHRPLSRLAADSLPKCAAPPLRRQSTGRPQGAHSQECGSVSIFSESHRQSPCNRHNRDADVGPDALLQQERCCAVGERNRDQSRDLRSGDEARLESKSGPESGRRREQRPYLEERIASDRTVGGSSVASQAVPTREPAKKQVTGSQDGVASCAVQNSDQRRFVWPWRSRWATTR